MRKCLPVLLLISCLISLPAHATIPLVLKAQFQIPPGTDWDVQHWVNDSTYGCASLWNDTVRYRFTESDSVHTFPIPHAAFDHFGFNNFLTHRRIRLARMPQSGADTCLVIQSWGGWIDYGIEQYSYTIVITCFNVNSDQPSRQGSDEVFHKTFNNHLYSYKSSFPMTIVWPPPPLDLSAVLVGYGATWNIDNYSSVSTSGYSLWFRPRADSLAGALLDSGQFVVPFSIYDSTGDFAAWKHNYYQDSWPNSPATYIDSCWVRMFRPGAEYHPWFYDSTYTGVWPQMDGEGTRRLIAIRESDYPAFRYLRAVDPYTGQVLWEIPMGENPLVARIAGSGNECILTYPHPVLRRDSSSVAPDGSVIDTTETCQGLIAGALRGPHQRGEFITTDLTSRLVRVYTTAPPSPNRVTIAILPEQNSIQLRWDEVPTAWGYAIYTANQADGVFTCVGRTVAGVLTYTLPMAYEQQFYYVAAEYDQP